MLIREELLDRYRIVDRSIPRVRMNFITSLDGAATRDGLSGALNNADDKQVFDTLRLLTDVIMVGAGTVRAEGYGGVRLEPADVAWRVAEGLPEQPALAIVSSRLDIDAGHPFFADAVRRPLVITHGASPAERRAALAEVADVLICGEHAVDPRQMLTALATRGLTQVLCEGGPHLFGDLLAADCVDELCLSVSPVLDAGRAGRIAVSDAATPRPMTLLHSFAAGDMLFLRYGRESAPTEP